MCYTLLTISWLLVILTSDELITLLCILGLRLILRRLTTQNVDVLESIECESVVVNLRDLLTFITFSDELTIGYGGFVIFSTLLLLDLTELQRLEQLRRLLQLRIAIGRIEDKHACDTQDVVQTNDLRNRTGDLVSDLKILSD